MKNFLELLDTSLSLDVKLNVELTSPNGQGSIQFGHRQIPVKDFVGACELKFDIPVQELVDIAVTGDIKLVNCQIEGHELWPEFGYQGVAGQRIEIKEPFYVWLHRIKGHGWLLEP